MNTKQRRLIGLCASLGAIALASAWTPARAADPNSVLDSSKTLAHRAQAATNRKVNRTLTKSVRVGGQSASVPLQGARIQLGQNYPHGLAPPGDVSDSQRIKLDGVEVQDRPLPGIPEDSLQADIPFGLAGIGWGLNHLDQAPRLFLPVIGTQPAPSAAPPAGNTRADLP
jgi:hypothetical protein